MSAAETYEIMLMALEASDRIFEFWITASFAVVLASYFASQQMSRVMYLLVSGIYALFSINMIVRWAIASSKMLQMMNTLIEAGEPFPQPWSIASGILTVTIFASGTLGTLYFVWYTYRQRDTGN